MASDSISQILEQDEDRDNDPDEMASLLEEHRSSQNQTFGGAPLNNSNIMGKLPPTLDPSRNKFAIGIKLKELSIRTCDETFEEVDKADLSKSGGLAYKKIAIDGLSLFVDWMDN